MMPSMLDDAGDASNLGSIHESISSNSSAGTLNGNADDTVEISHDYDEIGNNNDTSNHHHQKSTSAAGTPPPANYSTTSSNHNSSNSSGSNQNAVRPQTPSSRAGSENKAAQGQFSASRTPKVPGVLSPKRSGKISGAKSSAKDAELADYVRKKSPFHLPITRETRY